MSEHLPIEQTEMHARIVTVADEVWEIVSGWPRFVQDTVGRQWVRAIDSVGANLVEGDGRHSDADSIHFFVIARASLREAIYWLGRANSRRLLSPEQNHSLAERMDHTIRALNNLITYRRNRQKGKGVREELSPYAVMDEISAEDRTPKTEHRTPTALRGDHRDES